jgi:hypothetical protein
MHNRQRSAQTYEPNLALVLYLEKDVFALDYRQEQKQRSTKLRRLPESTSTPNNGPTEIERTPVKIKQLQYARGRISEHTSYPDQSQNA